MPSKSNRSRPAVAASRRKRGKSSLQLQEKAHSIDLGLAYRENFFDLVTQVVFDTENLKRRVADRRRKRCSAKIGPIADDLKFREALRRIGTFIAAATGHAGADPQLPELTETWTRDPERLMLFIESCVAGATDAERVKALRKDQVLVAYHDKAARVGRRENEALKGGNSGKVKHDARGKSYRRAMAKDVSAQSLFDRVSDGAIHKRSVRLGLESGVKMDAGSGEKPDAATVRAIALRTPHGRSR